MTVHIINPAAGKGKLSFEAYKRLSAEFADVCTTAAPGDCEMTVAARLADDPTLHFVIYGGDGTFAEAVNGVMKSGAADTASLTLVPTGSGNDFARVIPPDFDGRIDLIKYNTGHGDRYAANMLNIGFDCAVVDRMERYRRKWFVTGSGAYVFALIDTLCKKPTVKTEVTFTYADGTQSTAQSEFLLMTVAGGRYCGGGFESNCNSRLDDGLLDVLVANNISRGKFISLVRYYHDGTHLIRETGQPIEKFKDVISCRKCVSVKLSPLEMMCADGEVTRESRLEATVVHSAVRVLGRDFIGKLQEDK